MKFLQEELERLKREGTYRWLRCVEGEQGPRMTVDGRKVVILCSSNYLGLASHPRLKAAAIQAIERYGTSASAARLISGNVELYHRLEEALAAFKEREAALVYTNGYMANLGVIASLVGEGDAIFSDALNHASIVDGCRLSKADVRIFPHNDVKALEELLQASGRYRRRLIAVDGLYSMDGDLAPLPEIVALARRYEAITLVDDSHATGVLGKRGRGTAEHFGLEGAIDIEMGTLGKALGGFGAYIAGDRALKEFLINRSRSFIFTCALPPPVLATALAALEVLREEPEIRERLWENVRYFRKGLEELGFDFLGSETHIFPIMTYENPITMAMTDRLLELGVFAQGIRPPTVPKGLCRIRVTILASHTKEDLDTALSAFEKAGREFRVIA